MNDFIIIYACDINSIEHIDLINWQLYILKKYIEKIKIIFTTSIDEKLCFNKINIKKNNLIKINNVKLDIIKYQCGLLKINRNQYKFIIFMNDSFFFWRKVDDIFSFINNNKYEFLGILDNNQNKYHYQGWFWCLSNSIVDEILKFRANTDINYSQNMSEEYEINFSNYLINKYKSRAIYNYTRNIFSENDYLYKIENDDFPAIKTKFLFLMAEPFPYKKFPSDFNPVIYKSIYNELNQLTDNNAVDHFKNHGMHEKRLYKIYQKMLIKDRFLNYIPKELYYFFYITQNVLF